MRKRARVIYAPEDWFAKGHKKSEGTFVFLAGPIQGGPGWHRDLIEKYGEDPAFDDVIWVVPKRKTFDKAAFDWNEQVEWETKHLRMSDVVLFWIPPEVEHIEGRDYAQTTRVEFMESLARGKKVIAGISEGINLRRYMVYKGQKYGMKKVHDNLDDVMTELKEYLQGEYSKNSKLHYFTSDTHFSSDRTLELSVRPFRDLDDMDWTMIQRWNDKVPAHASVIHLGDFGNYDILKYLNGRVCLIMGNYERKEMEDAKISFEKKREELKSFGFDTVFKGESIDEEMLWTKIKSKSGKNGLRKVWLCHEPTLVKDSKKIGEGEYVLFGHIHGRQKMKPFGTDVGVDCNNYTPMSEEDVEFFMNALDKGYYDENVWIQSREAETEQESGK